MAQLVAGELVRRRPERDQAQQHPHERAAGARAARAHGLRLARRGRGPRRPVRAPGRRQGAGVLGRRRPRAPGVADGDGDAGLVGRPVERRGAHELEQAAAGGEVAREVAVGGQGELAIQRRELAGVRLGLGGARLPHRGQAAAVRLEAAVHAADASPPGLSGPGR